MTRYSKLLSQLTDYFRDKLSPAQRHEMERDVNADPFLSDAMDGFAKLSPDELDNDLAMLQQRLRNRTQPKSKKTFYLYFGVAASVAIIIGIGMLYYDFEKQSTKVAQQLEEKTVEKQPQPTPLKTEEKSVKKQPDHNQIKKEEKAEKQQTEQEAEQKTETVAVIKEQRKSPPPAEIAQSVVTKKVRSRTERKEVELQKKIEPEPVRQVAEENREEKEVLILPEKNIVGSTPSKLRNSAAITSATVKTQKIKGVVKGKDDNSPLPGVSIIVKGSDAGSVTNFNGEYEVEAKEGDTLVYMFIGYEEKELKVSEDMLENVDVSLTVDANELSDVVVVGYGTKNILGRIKSSLKRTKKRETYSPEGGSRKFKRYISRNKKIDKNGDLEIRATITIDTTGKVIHVQLLTNCDTDVREETIRLLKEGPRWKKKKSKPSENQNTEEVTIEL